MIGWILGIAAGGYICKKFNDYQDLKMENKHLKVENNLLKLTIDNHRTLLRDYDIVNSFAQNHNFKGAVSFFFYLSEHHDEKFASLARFLDKVRHVRNAVAHNGDIYAIDQHFLDTLKFCVEICRIYQSLPSGKVISLREE